MNKKIGLIALSATLALSLAITGLPGAEQANAKPFSGPCDIDNSLTRWKELNKWSKATGMCAGPLDVKPITKLGGKPKGSLSLDSALLPVEQCKIQNGKAAGLRAFPTQGWKVTHVGPSTRILFLPISSPDTKVLRKPANDYKQHFDFLKKWLEYINESPTKQSFEFRNEYYPLSFPILDFGVAHYNDPASRAFGRAFVDEVDPKFDFSPYDVVLVIPPAGTPRGKFEQGALGRYEVDGHEVIFMSVPPATYTTKFVPDFPMIAPAEWLHELYHVGDFSLQHHSENDYWQNGRGNDKTQPGTGEWGLMNMSKTDFLAWEKWLIGYLNDSQVACLEPSGDQRRWLIPSVVKAAGKKLAVVRISDTKVIALESIRAGGVNYKLAKKSEGLLVWTIDTTDPREFYGVKAIYPKNRKITKQPFVLHDAPLKLGESVAVEGIQIKVVEAGMFGDVFTLKMD